jgi:DNA-binding transcriptional LysR family regulator
MDLSKLKIFYIVAKEGSITKAAQTLNISQPALSRAIQHFECRLKCKLFERTARGVSLTSQGERIFAFADNIMQQAEAFQNMLYENEDEPCGQLKIVTTPGLGSGWLPYYIPKFANLYPNFNLSILRRMDKIDLREAEVAIRTFIPHDTNIIQRLLKVFKMKLWASPEYLEKFGVPKTAEDLNNHHILSFGAERFNPYGNCTWIEEVGVKAGFRRQPYMQINSLEGLTNLASLGMGIAELPESCLKFSNHNLVPVLSDLQGPEIPIYYIYNESMKTSKRITMFCDYLEEELAKEIDS